MASPTRVKGGKKRESDEITERIGCPVTVEELEQAVSSLFVDKMPYRPTLMLAYGPPGSGKSTMIDVFLRERGIEPQHTIFLAVDSLVTAFPEYQRDLAQLAPRPTWSTRRSESEVKTALPEWRAKRLAIYNQFRVCAGNYAFADALDRALVNRFDIVYETTGANISATPYQIDRARRLGYRTAILYPFVPLAVSIERVLAREQKTGQVGALPDFIAQAFVRAQENLIPLASEVDEVDLYDNTQPTPVLLFRFRRRYTFGSTTVDGECFHCDSPTFAQLTPPLRDWIHRFCPRCEGDLAVPL